MIEHGCTSCEFCMFSHIVDGYSVMVCADRFYGKPIKEIHLNEDCPNWEQSFALFQHLLK